MKKLILLILCVVSFNLNFGFAQGNPLACQATLCLHGKVTGAHGKASCAVSLQVYSNLRVFIYGIYIAPATAMLRHMFLSTCNAPTAMPFQQVITNVYGMQFYVSP